MVLIEDTRNQAGKHKLKNEYFKQCGITVMRSKLLCGDYALANDHNICIDSKNSLQEVIQDVCGKQHERFRAEAIRAQTAGIRLIVLIEETGIRDLNDVFRWRNPRLDIYVSDHGQIIGTYSNGRPKYRRVRKYPKATTGATLAKIMWTMAKKYSIEWVFCDPKDAGRQIIDILTEGKTVGQRGMDKTS